MSTPAQVSAHSQTETELARLEEEIAAAQATAGQFTALRHRSVELKTAIELLDDSIAGATDRIRWAEEAANILSCPNCDCRLVLRERELVPADPNAGDLAMSDEDLNKLRSTLAAESEQREQFIEQRTEVYNGITRAIHAKARLKILQQERERLAGD